MDSKKASKRWTLNIQPLKGTLTVGNRVQSGPEYVWNMSGLG